MFSWKSIKAKWNAQQLKLTASYLFIVHLIFFLQSSNVECPFDRVAEPQRTIDWYKERVGHLEESLEQAIYLNLKDFRPRSPPPQKPVKMSTAEFFGEGERLENNCNCCNIL